VIRPELSRPLPLDRLGRAGVTVEVTADAAELAAIAVRLGIPAVTALTCRFHLSRASDDPSIIVAEADLDAVVVQTCVVTLEPFEAPLREPFRLRFVPAGQESLDDDPESDDEVPYEGAALDLGEAAVEQIALALDPFPRRPDAILPDLGPEPAAGPFAALAARRRPPEDGNPGGGHPGGGNPGGGNPDGGGD
jgi:hypothetical protein